MYLRRSSHALAPLCPCPRAAPPMYLRRSSHALAPLCPSPCADPPTPSRHSAHPPAPSCPSPAPLLLFLRAFLPITSRHSAHVPAPPHPSPCTAPPIPPGLMMLPPFRTLAPKPPLLRSFSTGTPYRLALRYDTSQSLVGSFSTFCPMLFDKSLKQFIQIIKRIYTNT